MSLQINYYQSEALPFTGEMAYKLAKALNPQRVLMIKFPTGARETTTVQKLDDLKTIPRLEGMELLLETQQGTTSVIRNTNHSYLPQPDYTVSITGDTQYTKQLVELVKTQLGL